MVSYTNLFLIKGMTCWNAIAGWAHRVVRHVWIGWNTVRGVFHPDAGAWFLYSGSIFPISYRDYYDTGTAEWKYEPTTNTLQWMGKATALEAESEVSPYRLGWLSGQTSTVKETKDMDAFLNSLHIQTNGTSPPLMVLLQAWSLYERKWWSADPTVRIEWIDSFAEEHSAGSMDTPSLPLIRKAGRG